VVEEGLPCQLSNVGPMALPTKDPFVPMQGYYLNPGKVIKVIIEFHVESLVAGHSHNWDFTFYGATGGSGEQGSNY
jgi:hypothetical protein